MFKVTEPLSVLRQLQFEQEEHCHINNIFFFQLQMQSNPLLFPAYHNCGIFMKRCLTFMKTVFGVVIAHSIIDYLSTTAYLFLLLFF